MKVESPVSADRCFYRSIKYCTAPACLLFSQYPSSGDSEPKSLFQSRAPLPPERVEMRPTKMAKRRTWAEGQEVSPSSSWAALGMSHGLQGLSFPFCKMEIQPCPALHPPGCKETRPSRARLGWSWARVGLGNQPWLPESSLPEVR